MQYSVLITLEYLRLMISNGRLKYSILSMNLGAILSLLLCLKGGIQSVIIFKVPAMSQAHSRCVMYVHYCINSSRTTPSPSRIIILLWWVSKLIQGAINIQGADNFWIRESN